MQIDSERHSVFNRKIVDLNETDHRALIDIYKLSVEMADRISQRRQQANTFYLSINTALITAALYIGSQQGSSFSIYVISTIGIAIAAIWWRNITSYRLLNGSKFAVIQQIEQALPIAPYRTEWDILGRETKANHYREFYEVERLVPYVFGLLHFLNLCVTAFTRAN